MKEQSIEERMAIIRRAVVDIVDASDPVSNEIREELAKLPKADRAAFVCMAGDAVGELGAYIAAAGEDAGGA